jgi:hypothetical protein
LQPLALPQGENPPTKCLKLFYVQFRDEMNNPTETKPHDKAVSVRETLGTNVEVDETLITKAPALNAALKRIILAK